MTTPSTKALTRIHVAGYRSLRDVTLEPGRVTVLIGPNSAGKSNLLSFLQMIALLHTGGLRHFVAERGGASTLLHYGPKVTSEISFRLDLAEDDASSAYLARLGYAAGDKLAFVSEAATHRPGGAEAEEFTLVDMGHQESSLDVRLLDSDHPALETVSWWLKRMSFYHFHDTSMTSALRQNSPGSDNWYLKSDGRNLAAFLYRLMRSPDPGDRAAWRRIALLVRRIAPAVVELAPQPVAPGDHEDTPKHVQLRWRDDRGEAFGADALSDGTLRAIALVTALAQPASTLPAFISIDEPELGLHPAALALLAGLVRSVSTRCQIVLATQSPALLDHFSAEEVVVVERAEGASTFRRLVPEELQAWLAEYSLSELYDKNVLGGRP